MIPNPVIKPSPASPAVKSNRAPLTTVDGVAMLINKSIKTVYDRADGGDASGCGYQFVWNVATNPKGKIRHLRFWVPEIDDPKAVAILTLDEVISQILPVTRSEFPAGNVCKFLQIRPPTLALLRSELNGEVRRNSGYFPRAGLVKFFRSRWLGAAAVNQLNH
ncbi:MAG: hypothetical protein WCK57_07125 [Verrucomicrobiae bacterium]